MENRELSIRITFSRKGALLLLALFFVSWHPGTIGSETLTLTTYYPAPYGGYVSILTTGGTAGSPINTLLARDAGNVGVGNASPQVKLDVAQNTAIRVGRAILSSGGDYMHLANNEWYNGSSWQPTGGQGALLQMAGQAVNFYRHDGAGGHTQSLGLDASGNLTAHGNVTMSETGTNQISGICETRQYLPVGSTSCSANYRLMGHYGDGVTRYWGYMVTAQVNPDQRIGMGQDWGGWILCCRMTAVAR